MVHCQKSTNISSVSSRLLHMLQISWCNTGIAILRVLLHQCNSRHTIQIHISNHFSSLFFSTQKTCFLWRSPAPSIPIHFGQSDPFPTMGTEWCDSVAFCKSRAISIEGKVRKRFWMATNLLIYMLSCTLNSFLPCFSNSQHLGCGILLITEHWYFLNTWQAEKELFLAKDVIIAANNFLIWNHQLFAFWKERIQLRADYFLTLL